MRDTTLSYKEISHLSSDRPQIETVSQKLTKSRVLSWIARWHGRFVFERRAQVLADMIASRIPQGASVLDIGCGDGTIGSQIKHLRPDITIRGVEVLVRPACKVACSWLDGLDVPFADGTFDASVLFDVLHHTAHPRALLCEAARISKSAVLIKDHLSENFLDNATLRLMDWFGNRPHGVRLTYNYQPRRQWLQHFQSCGLIEVSQTMQIPLYPPPFNLVFGRELHFISLLKMVAAY